MSGCCASVGKGTWGDPKRPLFAPAPGEVKPNDRSGIIAWHFEPSDDDVRSR